MVAVRIFSTYVVDFRKDFLQKSVLGALPRIYVVYSLINELIEVHTMHVIDKDDLFTGLCRQGWFGPVNRSTRSGSLILLPHFEKYSLYN